jgi:spore maturation protein CgeB
MQFLIVNTRYPETFQSLYAQYPGLEFHRYEDQVQAYMNTVGSVEYFYCMNLRKLGHDGQFIVPNNEFAQKAWARENGMRVGESTTTSRKFLDMIRVGRRMAAHKPLHFLKPMVRHLLGTLAQERGWYYDILEAQVKQMHPDILINMEMNTSTSDFIKTLKPYVKVLVAEGDAALSLNQDLSGYDLIRCSLPSHVEHFRQLGIPSELYLFGFEPELLPQLKNEGKNIDISFVGSLSSGHKCRIQLLSRLCERLDVKIWSRNIDYLPIGCGIEDHYMGQVFGVPMLQILHNSKITLNNHLDAAGPYSDNVRLYDATGVGTLLVTDYKENLPQLFEPGREVVVYRHVEECLDLVEYYLNHGEERETIARAGQQRTLCEHSYFRRMQGLVEMIRRYMR